MNKKKTANFWLYRQRYILAYGFLILSFLSILAFSIFVAPNGLTRGEISTATSAFNLDFSNIFSKEIINAPFKILQKISISLLGLSNFSIKLPAILLSIFSIFLIIKLSHAWHGRGVATISAILATASSQFFFFSQSGNAEILQAIYPIALAVLGFEYLNKKSKFALYGMAGILGISLYSPAGILLTAAFCLMFLAHPKLRFEISKINSKDKYIALGIFSALFLPVAVAIFANFETLGALFGVSGEINIWQNLLETGAKLFTNTTSNTGELSPIITPPVIVLIAVGIYAIVQAWHTPRAYIIYVLTLLAVVACAFTPANSALFFAPILLLTTTGLYSLIQAWYVLFPKNPYARVFGLIPISIFLFSFLTVNLNFFRLSYLHSPEVAKNFNQDLSILLQNSSSEDKLVVSEEEKPFFEILERQGKIKLDGDSEQIIISKEAYFGGTIKPNGFELHRIITSSRKENSDRFYILKKQ